MPGIDIRITKVAETKIQALSPLFTVTTGAGAMRVTFRIRGYYDKTADSLSDIAEEMLAGGTEATLEIYPQGTATGNEKFGGTAGITGVTPTFTKGRFAVCEASGYINGYARSTVTSS